VTFNPNAFVSQKYNIVEYLVQAPCAISTLEVLHHYPSQRRTLLSIIGAMDQEESKLIMFNLDYFKERIYHNLAIQIEVLVGGKNIHPTILDKGASTCVMSLPCWRALSSPNITQSPTTLKEFDGCGFKPYKLLQYFVVTLKGKTVLVNIEVVDVPLNYDLLLVRTWFYVMIAITSSVFRILQFPHQGKIIIVDQLDYTTPDLHNAATNNAHFLGC
jgi:hypothetical protein